MSIKTVKVSNLSHAASERDMRGFFSFCGDIVYIEMKSESEQSQTAFITYKDPRGAETAILLTGAIIVGQIATIALEPDYVLPAAAASESSAATEDNKLGASPSAAQKAEDVVRRMLDKGYTLGKDAVHRAKAFDERHQLRSRGTAKVASLDQKYGLSEKINKGAAIVNDKVKKMDDKFHVSEKTKSAFASAEQTVGTAIKNNKYVAGGTTWVTGALNRVTQPGGEAGVKSTEKAGAQADHGTNVAHHGGGTDPSGSPGTNVAQHGGGTNPSGSPGTNVAQQGGCTNFAGSEGTNVAQQGGGTNPAGSPGTNVAQQGGCTNPSGSPVK
ncbi:binding partner of ACD11 1 isoform X2 [Sesamum indicum]|uniref:Binding partner of ACD11 1 isoform X2 n=1 Tax=Sesamum indicum TaxID=4182 RepID=A0A6I9TK71_SESIN|nr:binding partner of ACD11 1 isoform X2 [Sesamum indicum]